MPDRNLKDEQEAVAVFKQRHGRMPNLQNPEERKEVYDKAYPDTNLPEELKGTVKESQDAAGISTPKIPDVKSDDIDTSRLNKLGEQVQEKGQEFEELAHPNEALRIFQRALRKKTGVGDQRLGKSEIFQEADADLSGMGALQSSLSARKQEMDMNQTEYNNLVQQVGGIYQDRLMSAQINYNRVKDMYDQEMDRINKLDAMARQHEMQKDIIQMEHELALEEARVESSLESQQTSQAGFAYTTMQQYATQNAHLPPAELEDNMRKMKNMYDLDLTDGDIDSIIENRFNRDIQQSGGGTGGLSFPGTTPSGEPKSSSGGDTGGAFSLDDWISDKSQQQGDQSQQQNKQSQIGTEGEEVYEGYTDPYAEMARDQEGTSNQEPPKTEFQRMVQFIKQRKKAGSDTLDADVREYMERRGTEFDEKELDEAFAAAYGAWTPAKFKKETQNTLESLKNSLEQTGTEGERTVGPEELMNVWARQERNKENGLLTYQEGNNKIGNLPRYQQIELKRILEEIYDREIDNSEVGITADVDVGEDSGESWWSFKNTLPVMLYETLFGEEDSSPNSGSSGSQSAKELRNKMNRQYPF